ncbi:hypothetical protein O181_005898 [Austropuccinia psidii MF-1]|uniref:Uncharacterized protein n=1 Tax=Austropuccinia psidii MF-1 TaxID=1389203 RepID=A0A9Q3BJE7_9BASI|nr:hypothetical protein [Austropuccinia psidii MF-1]
MLSKEELLNNKDNILNIFEEVIPRIRFGSSRVKLKTRFNEPWKDCVEKNSKETSKNIKYKCSETIKKFHLCQRTTNSVEKFPKRGKINEINIEKEPDVKTDDVYRENSDDKSSIFSESSKDIENINVTADIMESYPHLPQLSNIQLYFSKLQDAQLMKTKRNKWKIYTAVNSCIAEVVIDKKPTRLLLDLGAPCFCVEKCFVKNCLPCYEDQLLPIDGIK